MRLEQLDRNVILYHPAEPTGPVRLVQLNQYWTRTQSAGLQPSSLRRQALNSRLKPGEQAGHLAIATRALDLGPQIEAAEAMLAVQLPDWGGDSGDVLTMDQRLVRHANEFMSLQCRLPKGCFLTLVNTQRIERTWTQWVEEERVRRFRREQYALTLGHQREAAETDWYRLRSALARMSGLTEDEVGSAFAVVHDEARAKLSDLVRIADAIEAKALATSGRFPAPQATAHAHSRSQSENVAGRAL